MLTSGLGVLSQSCPTNPRNKGQVDKKYKRTSADSLEAFARKINGFLTAVQIGLLTIYDMCKAADRGMTMTDVKVLEKHGGKSGSFVA